MDISKIVAASRSFYRDHKLPAFAAALPKKPLLPAAGADVIAYADRCGFDCGFAFPPFPLQLDHLAAVLEETLLKPASGLPDDQQYTKAYISDNWDKQPNGKVVQRSDNLGPRADGPYILLLSGSPEKAVFEKNCKQMIGHFEGKNWTGLTVIEYLILQRHFCESYKDHRFFATPLDESRCHWLWLTDSATENACAVAAGSSKGATIYACKIGTRDARRGAVPTLVVPLD